MAKTIITANAARALMVTLVTARLERIETSVVDQIETACESQDTETIWRAPLPAVLRTKLTNNNYTVTVTANGFVISWAAA